MDGREDAVRGDSDSGGDAGGTSVPRAAAEAHDWKRLDARSVTVSRRVGVITTAVVFVASMIVAVIAALLSDSPVFLGALLLPIVFVGSAVLGTLSWIVPEKQYRYTRYRLDPLGLVILKGRIFHKQVGVLRSRIQHTDVSQGPVQRAFELATLTIHTAGHEEPQIVLSGIAFDEAQRLRLALTGLQAEDVV